MLWLLVLLFVVCCPLAAQPVYDAADRLNLLPTPREMLLSGGAQSLTGWEMVITPEVPLLQTGADEINSRITDLGGIRLPVLLTPPDRPAIFIGRWQDPYIRDIAMALDATLSADEPGEQGYIIRFGDWNDRPVILIGGSDAQGALYGCVTFRHLLQRNGTVVEALTGAVRDWPDFKVRMNGRLDLGMFNNRDATPANPGPLYAAAGTLKREIDWFLRHKINYLSAGYVFRQEGDDPDVFALRRDLALDVLAYARARGIRTRFSGGAEVSAYLTPEQDRLAVTRHRGSKYLFSALDAHRANARKYASFLGPARAGYFSFHPNDSGGYLDPGMWRRHAPETRHMFGNDLGRASLEQFMLYFDEARAAVPDIELEAVVYPYHYQYARRDFPQTYKDLIPGTALSGMLRGIRDTPHARQLQTALMEYHAYLSRTLPKDAAIVFREAGREEFTACADLFDGHPLTIWTYPDCNNGWLGSFCPQVRMARTFWFPGRRDVFYVASAWSRWGDWRVNRLAQQEYLWNTGHPDASIAFSQRARTYEGGGREVSAFQQAHLIPRISRILYGAAAPAFSVLIAANVSLAYAADPVSVALGEHDGEDFDDPWKYLGEQFRLFAKLSADFAAVNSMPDPSTAAWVRFYQRYTGLAAIKTELELIADQCRKALNRGDSGGADHLARTALDRMSGFQRQVDALPPLMPGDKRLRELDTFRPADIQKIFQDIITRSERRTRQSSTPFCDMTGGVRVNQTTTFGYATVIRFELLLHLTPQSGTGQIMIDILDSAGQPAGSTWFPAALITERHINPKPVMIDLGDVVEGNLRIEVRLQDSNVVLGTFMMDAEGAIRKE